MKREVILDGECVLADLFGLQCFKKKILFQSSIEYHYQHHCAYQSEDKVVDVKQTINGKEPCDEPEKYAESKMQADVDVILGLEDTVIAPYLILSLATLPTLLEIEFRFIVNGIVPTIQIVHYISDHLHLF